MDREGNTVERVNIFTDSAEEWTFLCADFKPCRSTTMHNIEEDVSQNRESFQ